MWGKKGGRTRIVQKKVSFVVVYVVVSGVVVSLKLLLAKLSLDTIQ